MVQSSTYVPWLLLLIIFLYKQQLPMSSFFRPPPWMIQGPWSLGVHLLVGAPLVRLLLPVLMTDILNTDRGFSSHPIISLQKVKSSKYRGEILLNLIWYIWACLIQKIQLSCSYNKLSWSTSAPFTPPILRLWGECLRLLTGYG